MLLMALEWFAPENEKFKKAFKKEVERSRKNIYIIENKNKMDNFELRGKDILEVKKYIMANLLNQVDFISRINHLFEMGDNTILILDYYIDRLFIDSTVWLDNKEDVKEVWNFMNYIVENINLPKIDKEVIVYKPYYGSHLIDSDKKSTYELKLTRRLSDNENFINIVGKNDTNLLILPNEGIEKDIRIDEISKMFEINSTSVKTKAKSGLSRIGKFIKAVNNYRKGK